ncbi:MAG: hypothetical protein GF411_13675 [Candidatus Lokiarchaeota archaeon]|nr:hypothetical protein [Candidatus Lokiarchaeota archaeon]
MERTRLGLIIAIGGVIIFLIAMLILLPEISLYVPALLVMFIGITMIGIGGAIAKGFDRSLDVPETDCYYCNGSGKIQGPEGSESCPRCGGTGLARPDDE